MAKRFTSTEIWNEDWFLELPIEYKLFWFYMLSTCDQAGFFKINLKRFCELNKCQIDSETAIELFNKGKKRIRKVNGSMLLVEEFFKFQYGHKFNTTNKMHLGIEKIYNGHGVSMQSLGGIERVSKGSQET